MSWLDQYIDDIRNNAPPYDSPLEVLDAIRMEIGEDAWPTHRYNPLVGAVDSPDITAVEYSVREAARNRRDRDWLQRRQEWEAQEARRASTNAMINAIVCDPGWLERREGETDVEYRTRAVEKGKEFLEMNKEMLGEFVFTWRDPSDWGDEAGNSSVGG